MAVNISAHDLLAPDILTAHILADDVGILAVDIQVSGFQTVDIPLADLLIYFSTICL